MQLFRKKPYYSAANYQHISKNLFPNNKNKDIRQIQLIPATLNKGKSVVGDNTSSPPFKWVLLIEIGSSYGCKIISYYFEFPLSLYLERKQQLTGKTIA